MYFFLFCGPSDQVGVISLNLSSNSLILSLPVSNTSTEFLILKIIFFPFLEILFEFL